MEGLSTAPDSLLPIPRSKVNVAPLRHLSTFLYHLFPCSPLASIVYYRSESIDPYFSDGNLGIEIIRGFVSSMREEKIIVIPVSLRIRAKFLHTWFYNMLLCIVCDTDNCIRLRDNTVDAPACDQSAFFPRSERNWNQN